MIEYKSKKEVKSANTIAVIGAILIGLVIALGYFVSGEYKANFTVEDYWEIEEGMDYEEVTEILNDHGAEISKQHISPEVTTTTYQFISDKGGFAWISFENGKVTSKSQSKLNKEKE